MGLRSFNTRISSALNTTSPSHCYAMGPFLSPAYAAERRNEEVDSRAYDFGAVDAFCAPQKPNSVPATRRIWISSEPSVMR